MPLTKEKTSALITKFGANAKDTGNAQVQIAIMTERIRELTEHCKTFKKDKSASRSLIKIVGQRRRLLKYLQSRELEAYRALIKELGLRK
ncbi:MAG: 30S ribosomal protein S15 [Treponemataceae bacterium]